MKTKIDDHITKELQSFIHDLYDYASLTADGICLTIAGVRFLRLMLEDAYYLGIQHGQLKKRKNPPEGRK